MMLGSQLEEQQRREKQPQQDHNWKQIMGWRHHHVNVQLISDADLQFISRGTEEPSDGNQLPLTKRVVVLWAHVC